jgi:hypothetical protein
MRGEGLQPRLALLLCATRAHLLTQAKKATVLLYPNDGNPFPDGCQREGLTQRRIPGAKVSGIAKTYQA